MLSLTTKSPVIILRIILKVERHIVNIVQKSASLFTVSPHLASIHEHNGIFHMARISLEYLWTTVTFTSLARGRDISPVEHV